jgi:RHS repeat-associated protein
LNRISNIAALSGGYDARGNLTFDGQRSFTYDVENRLRSASGGGAPITLDYDPQGRLRQIAGSATTQLLYDGDRLVAEYDGGASTPLRRYVHGIGIDEPLVWYEGATPSSSTRRWLHADRQGSIIAWSNGSKTAVPYTYGPYGEPQDWSGSRFRYTGQIALPEAQLYHYKARAYDPHLGRFLQTDPINQDDDVNLYAYVKGDPANKADPTGMMSKQAECKDACATADKVAKDAPLLSRVADAVSAGLDKAKEGVKSLTATETATKLISKQGGAAVTAVGAGANVAKRQSQGEALPSAAAKEGAATAGGVAAAIASGRTAGAAIGVLAPDCDLCAIGGAAVAAVVGGIGGEEAARDYASAVIQIPSGVSETATSMRDATQRWQDQILTSVLGPRDGGRR